ncbi:hypothetical protein [Streptomyces viridochromogenes]|uniref:hypothetical protein n=1 Tax=Streptomyces viridochromogenes TaxID=1938 RepID=UPI001F2EAC6F|nr:hypothetical protein [Streptomyces viridochromogenes]
MLLTDAEADHVAGLAVLRRAAGLKAYAAPPVLTVLAPRGRPWTAAPRGRGWTAWPKAGSCWPAAWTWPPEASSCTRPG